MYYTIQGCLNLGCRTEVGGNQVCSIWGCGGLTVKLYRTFHFGRWVSAPNACTIQGSTPNIKWNKGPVKAKVLPAHGKHTQPRIKQSKLKNTQAVCFLHLWLYFYFVNKFTCTIFLDSTYKPRGKVGGKNKLGDWDWHIHTTIYKIDN